MISSRPGKIFLFFMKKSRKNLYIGILIVIFFAVFMTWTSDVQVTTIPSDPKTQNIEAEIKNNSALKNIPEYTESATILAGDTTVKLSFASNITFYDALIEEKNTGKIEFAGKNYPGLGFFVTGIGTL